MSLSRWNKVKSALFAILSLLFLLSAGSAGVRAEAVETLEASGFVNDFAGVIDAETKKRLETVLTNLKERTKIEFAVVTVRNLNGQDRFDYSLALARRWGIGDPDGEKNGLLLLVAIDDRKYFTQVSRHLEGDLPDGLVGQIQREKLVPKFQQGQYSQGIYDTAEAYVATLAEKRGFSVVGIDQKRAYRGTDSPEDESGGRGFRGFSPCAIIFIIILLLLIFSGRSRGGGGGCLNLFLLGSLLNSGSRGRWGGGRWSSGWGGGGFGGSGGGGGGFGGFGGGGDFGGGGAGGSW